MNNISNVVFVDPHSKGICCQNQIIFPTHKPVLVLTSGSNQVNEEVVGAVIGEEINIASAKFVREMTGFAIGGVSPFGLKEEITTYIDEDLLQHPVIWAAAGSHNAVFSICPEDLVNAINGQVISVV